MGRPPKYHHLDSLYWPAGEVLPGDIAIAPGTIAWKLSEQINESRQLRLALSPFLIVGLEITQSAKGGELYTYYLLTRHGILIVLRDEEQKA